MNIHFVYNYLINEIVNYIHQQLIKQFLAFSETCCFWEQKIQIVSMLSGTQMTGILHDFFLHLSW